MVFNMLKFLILFAFLIGSLIITTNAFAVEIELQPESERIVSSYGWDTPEKTALLEEMQIIIDETDKKNRISIGLLSTDPNDIRFPDHLENVMLDPRLISFQLTNSFACAHTKLDKSCIIIEVDREGLGDTIKEIQENGRKIADMVVEPGVIVFAPEYYSVTVQSRVNADGTEKIPVAQVIYTINKQPTSRLFDALTPVLINSDIIKAGGFYTYADKLSDYTLSEFNISLLPTQDGILRSLYVSFTCSNLIIELPRCDMDGTIDEQIRQGIISPTDFIQQEKIERSKIFGDKFMPLNSVIQVLILSDNELYVKDTNSNVIEKLENLGDIQNSGWIFMEESGTKIDARYLFGQELEVSKNDLVFSINYLNSDMKMEEKEGGGCLIATAAFGSEMSPQVQLLREIRDNTVLQTESGTSFMTGFNQFYYSFSPTIADYERENPAFKEAVKITLTPLLASLTLLQYADIDSESEMLGYGIGIILLNIGMYFIAPTALIVSIKKLI